jgi:hypothetical protein
MSARRALSALIYVLVGTAVSLPLRCQQDPPASGSPLAWVAPLAGDGSGADAPTDKPALLPVGAAPLIAPVTPLVRPVVRSEPPTGVNWTGLLQSSLRFLAVEHSFRLATEPGTRSGLKGSFIKNYGTSVANLHGWADGDEFYVNYVGHPMQGGVAGFLWMQNDRTYNRAGFGKDPAYWKGRARAAAFIWVYSTQFEIGPLSEASIGAIQSYFPQQGFVDHVVTPVIGTAWMIGEDFMDEYVAKRVEGATRNPYIRMLVRSSINPARTFANVLNGQVPWHRTTRPGVNSYVPAEYRQFLTQTSSGTGKRAATQYPEDPLIAPFEFALTVQPERFWGGGRSTQCLGGGANAAFRLSTAWQMVTDVSGCKLMGLEKNLSGDSLTYAVGPRWTGRIQGPWSVHLQLLVGGNKVTEERMYPEKKKLLEAIAARTPDKEPPTHGDYTEETESHGFALATSGGVNYQATRAITVRVADVSYRHNWTSPLWGRDLSNSLKFTSGVVLRMGTW